VKIPLKVLGLDETTGPDRKLRKSIRLAKILPYRVDQFSGGRTVRFKFMVDDLSGRPALAVEERLQSWPAAPFTKGRSRLKIKLGLILNFR